jgi:hypothetical protein
MKLKSGLFIVIILNSVLPAQVMMGNYPIKPGNYWVYRDYFYPSGSPFTMRVLDSTVTIDSLTYNVIKYQTNVVSYRSIRFDSLTNFAVNRLDENYPAPDNEYKYFKHNGNVGDSWVVPDPAVPQQNLFVEIFDVGESYVFGELINLYQYYIHDSIYIYNYGEFWTEKFGMIVNEDDMGQPVEVLTGCVIDGIVYGDTSTVVGVEEIHNPVKYFELSQNYPNPFNSSSIIKYSIPISSQVTLKIFNTLGEEIETLVNEEKPAGSYSVKFDGNKLPSGVYIYRLTAGNYSAARKLVLLK